MFPPTYPPVEDMSETYARPLPKVYGIGLFAIRVVSQGSTSSAYNPGVARPPPLRAPLLLCAEEVEPWLTTQWQTEK